MINVDVIRGLIDRISEVKLLFSTKSYSMVSYYDRKTRKKKELPFEVQTIREQPEFLRWREQLCFELDKIEGDAYIAEIMKLLTHFNGLNDKENFDKLETKLYVLRDHLEEYRNNYC